MRLDPLYSSVNVDLDARGRGAQHHNDRVATIIRISFVTLVSIGGSVPCDAGTIYAVQYCKTPMVCGLAKKYIVHGHH
jgi:hypothetical protein